MNTPNPFAFEDAINWDAVEDNLDTILAIFGMPETD